MNLSMLLLLLAFVNSTVSNVVNDERGLVFENHVDTMLSIPLELKNVTQQTSKVDDKMDCVFACTSKIWCRSANYKVIPEKDGKHLCEQISADSFSHQNYIKQNSSYILLSVKNPCEKNPCLHDGWCLVHRRIDYKCQCKEGFKGEHCEKDVDECTTRAHGCHSNAKCSNTFGSFKCKCKLSYVGDGFNCVFVPQSCFLSVQNNIARYNGIQTLSNNSGGTYKAFCDVTNGGWTLIARFSNADTRNWMQDSGHWWYDVKSGQRHTLTPNHINRDMISPAFWTVAGNEIKITRTDDTTHTALLRTTSNCLNSKTFRAKITGYGNFRNDAVWASDACLGSCDVIFGGNYASTLGFEMASCNGEIQNASRIGFWCDWNSGDGAVMMIGGGGTNCNRADHGIGITEEENASFRETGQGENDFGREAGINVTTNYALNLWIR